VTCNIETKEHDEELDSSSLCPWGPLTLEQTKNMMMGNQVPRRRVPGIYNTGTKKARQQGAELLIIVHLTNLQH